MKEFSIEEINEELEILNSKLKDYNVLRTDPFWPYDEGKYKTFNVIYNEKNNTIELQIVNKNVLGMTLTSELLNLNEMENYTFEVLKEGKPPIKEYYRISECIKLLEAEIIVLFEWCGLMTKVRDYREAKKLVE